MLRLAKIAAAVMLAELLLLPSALFLGATVTVNSGAGVQQCLG